VTHGGLCGRHERGRKKKKNGGSVSPLTHESQLETRENRLRSCRHPIAGDGNGLIASVKEKEQERKERADGGIEGQYDY